MRSAIDVEEEVEEVVLEEVVGVEERNMRCSMGCAMVGRKCAQRTKARVEFASDVDMLCGQKLS